MVAVLFGIYNSHKMEEKIKKYFLEKGAEALGLEVAHSIVISEIKGGDYNLNYKIVINNRSYLLRLTAEAQSGRSDQARYEYETLRFLMVGNLAPRPYYIDDSRKYFPYDLIIEEYIEGNKIMYEEGSLRRCAHAIAALHALPIPQNSFFSAWENPLECQLSAVENALLLYRQRKVADKKLVAALEDKLLMTKQDINTTSVVFSPKSLVHTDLVFSNMIDTGERVYIIDWEKARIDDPSYDIAVFLSPVANVWDAPRALNESEQKIFLKEYIEHSGDESIAERAELRSRLFTMQAALWAAGRIADVEAGSIRAELGKLNYERYQRVLAACNLL